MSEPEHSLEIECKYDVDERTPVPDWSALPGVHRVGSAEVRELDARYLDTSDGALARALTVVRRRTGGPDAGWHVKRSTLQGKWESRWPLEAGTESPDIVVPDEIIAAVASIASPPFDVVARIQNSRTAYALFDGQGGVVAEFVDDRVTATDIRRGGVRSRWREWELELGPAAPAAELARDEFFAAADALVIASGGRVSTSESKLGRALGAEEPGAEEPGAEEPGVEEPARK